ncbi:hypothetical protein AMECASPLE_013572 [Ameca splendens]|uniref:Uncharacterized protein n=1 Tax=Ameca splendens TaxID=208324 RepID=A0ABV0YP69_9TELE
MVRQNTDGEEETQQKMTLQRLSMLIDALDVNCGDSFHAAMCFLIPEDQEHPGWKCDWAEASMKHPEMLTHTVIAPGSPPQHVTAV